MNKYFGLNSFVLSFRRFYPRHLSKELKDTIMKELNKLDILSKCVSITTDSGSDIKSATKNLNGSCR